MATIRKRGSAWQAQVPRQGSAPISRRFATKSDAALWARDLERSIDRAELPHNIRDLKRVTLADLLARYEAEVTVGTRGAARELYKLRVIRSHAVSTLHPSKLTSSALCGDRDDRLRMAGAGTVRRELAILQHCLEDARREWRPPLPANPMQGITLPRPAKARDRRLGLGDEQKLSAAIQSNHAWYLRPLMELAAEKSMRRGELLSLLWANVDFEKADGAPTPYEERRRSNRSLVAESGCGSQIAASAGCTSVSGHRQGCAPFLGAAKTAGGAAGPPLSRSAP